MARLSMDRRVGRENKGLRCVVIVSFVNRQNTTEAGVFRVSNYMMSGSVGQGSKRSLLQRPSRG
eukprot:3298783-Lingulodinium_polyedra.AAC.1